VPGIVIGVVFLVQLSGGVGRTTPSAAEPLAVVDHTMRPTATSLWLRPSATDSVPASAGARPG
jgi:hypothetical protein